MPGWAREHKPPNDFINFRSSTGIQFRQLTSIFSNKLESVTRSTSRNTHNDSKSHNRRYKSSNRIYIHANTVLQKHSKAPYFLIAWTLLEQSPMYDPSNSNFRSTISPPVSYYINLDNFEQTEPEPTPAPNISIQYNAMSSNSRDIKTFTFDTDSFKIGIDTHATTCMSPEITDFDQSTLVPFPAQNGGIRQYGKGPLLKIESTGTLKWILEDDNGNKHTVHIPNSIYCPQGTQRLLSPQHWGSECNKAGNRNPDSTHSIQYHDRNVLYFGNNGQYRKTVYNNKSSNVPTFHTAPGNSTYKIYSTTVHTAHSSMFHKFEQAVCHPATAIISDDESSVTPPSTNEESPILLL